MLRMSCSNDGSVSSQEVVPQSSNLADLLKTHEGDAAYDPEKRLQTAILDRSVSVTANGEEKVGFVVEVRVERNGVIIDFAGGYSFEVGKDNISDIHYVAAVDVEAYFKSLVNVNNQPFDFGSVRRRISRTLEN